MLSLTACNEQAKYARYIQNPQLLTQTLNECQLGKLTGRTCARAQLTKQVISDFMSQAAGLALAEERLMSLQQQLQGSPGNSSLQSEETIQETLVNQQFMELQENFAKQIMNEETKLSQLQMMQNQLKRALKKVETNDYEAKAALLKSLAINEELFSLTREKLKIMLLFVGLSNKVEG